MRARRVGAAGRRAPGAGNAMNPQIDNPQTDHGTASPAVVYKIVSADLWRTAVTDGVFRGAPVDHRDGYIHLSTAGQVRETAARHFAGLDDLVLVAVDAAALGPALRFEPSRGGALFPHLYGDLPVAAAIAATALPLGPDGAHRFPEALP